MTGLRRLDRGGEFSFSWLRRFNSLGRDGFLAIILAEPEPAAALSGNRDIRVRLHRFGSARAALAHMPATSQASALDAIKRNDVLFSQQTGFPLEKMNNFGYSLIWGHPQAPMGTRGGDRAAPGIGTAEAACSPPALLVRLPWRSSSKWPIGASHRGQSIS